MTRWISSLAIAPAVLLTAGCTLFDPADPDLHSWGAFQLCLERLSDECVDDGACLSQPFETTRSVTLSGRRSDGTFVFSRQDIDPAFGRQAGDRFEVELGPVRVPSYCGCEMEARETLRGTLLRTPRESGCAAEPGETCGAAGPPDDGEDWLDPDAPFDPYAHYLALEGTVVTELVPVDGAEGCRCGPCRILWRLGGGRR